MSEYICSDELEDAKRDAEKSENYYNSAMREVRRLRCVAGEYSDFYNKISDAFKIKSWDGIERALKECE